MTVASTSSGGRLASMIAASSRKFQEDPYSRDLVLFYEYDLKEGDPRGARR